MKDCAHCKHSRYLAAENGRYCFAPSVATPSVVSSRMIPTLCDVKPCGAGLPRFEAAGLNGSARL